MQSVFHVATAALAGIGQTVGIRYSVEEPRYTVEAKLGDIEIRRYDERIAAEVEVKGSVEEARSAGFRRIASYIFGSNEAKESIAMTAPVAQAAGTGQTIAMTAPVAQVLEADDHWKIQFFMPSSYTRETLPTPKDETVRIVAVPAQSYAVLQFRGDRGGKAVAAKQARLIAALRETRWRPIGAPVAWFYDPPWTLPPMRRNEVAVVVVQAS